MADYYSILNKTISGLPNNSTQTRQLVYAKARTAIDKQLRAIEPSPGEAAIARQIEMLEEAIGRLEAEQVAAEQAAAPAVPAAAPAAIPAEPPAEAPPVQEAAPAQPSPPAQPAPVTPPPAQPEPVQPEPAQSEPVEQAAAPVAPAAEQVAQAAPATAQSPQPQLPPEPTIAAAPTAPAAQPDGVDAPSPEAPVAAQQAAADGPPVPPPPAYDASLDALLDEADHGDTARSAGARDAKPAKASGGFAGIILTVVLIAVIGLGGYLLWRNKDPLLALIGAGEPAVEATAPSAGGGDGDATETEQATQTEVPAASEGPKEEARLGADGEEIAPEPRVVTPQAPETTQEPAQDAASETATQSEQPASTEAEVNPVEVEPAGDQAALEGDGAETAAAADPAVAQTAYLYEEGSGSSAATRDNAAVIWSLAQEVPAAGQPPEAVIVGKLDVPGRGLTMNMRIRRNIDESLPASHLIELAFATPPDFAGGNVDTLARFVMKANEQSRGEPLVAVPARVMPGNFIIALNNLERARQSNERLMLESNWIDIPLGYASGRRALVTLEKGAVGQQVFRDAFADWQSR